MALLSNVTSLAAYTSYTYYPVRVKFNYERPKSLKEYYRLFNCSLSFEQEKSEIIYDRKIINLYSNEIKLRLLENLKQKVAIEIEKLPTEKRLIYDLKKSILNHKPKRCSSTHGPRREN